MIRVLVTNTKGGVGKTTIATTLASAYAAGRLKTALADVDRQHSSLDWLAQRPATARPIIGLDWSKAVSPPPAGIERLVIDAPANLRLKEVDELIAEADLVILPLLPSAFDQASTARFLRKLDKLKPVRKGRKGIAVIANRVRARAKAAQRLDAFLADCGQPVPARITDRAIYGELAVAGLALFDTPAARHLAAKSEWTPLLTAIEATA